MSKAQMPQHVCKGCGKCYVRGRNWGDLVREYVKHPERFREGVCAKPEVLTALQRESQNEK